MKNSDKKSGSGQKPRPAKSGPAKAPGTTPGVPRPAMDPGEQERLAALARLVIDQAPDLQKDKVARLKEAVKQGAYKVDARKVANALIAELLRKR
jgi:flagellar biosynthesis anti-sigma factor FlgM